MRKMLREGQKRDWKRGRESKIERECRGEEKTVTHREVRRRQKSYRTRKVLVRKWVRIRNANVIRKELGR